jgi:hypothetical protein
MSDPDENDVVLLPDEPTDDEELTDEECRQLEEGDGEVLLQFRSMSPPPAGTPPPMEDELELELDTIPPPPSDPPKPSDPDDIDGQLDRWFGTNVTPPDPPPEPRPIPTTRPSPPPEEDDDPQEAAFYDAISILPDPPKPK